MSKDNLTQYSIEELKCPKCGHAHHLKKYSLINVTEKPEMKEDILKNRIFNFDCENCDLVVPLTYESIYLDSKKKLLICLSTEETDMRQFEEWERKKGMTLRVVDNINDLKEKIMIAENLLDDRVVEMVKIAYLRRLEKEMKEDTLQNILFDYNGNHMYFLVFFEKKGIGRMPFDLELYRSTATQFDRQIKAHSTDTFMKVDMKWAGDIYFQRN